jgi:transporter family protein
VTNYLVWVALAFLIAACWGIIVVLNKRALQFVDPLALNLFVRVPSLVLLTAAIALLSGLHLWHVGFAMTWQAAGYMTLASISTWVIAFNTYFFALRSGRVGVVAPITSTDPLFTALFAVLLLGAALSALLAAGLAVASVGIVLISRWAGVPADPHGEVLTAAPPTARAAQTTQLRVVALSLVTAAAWGLSPVLIQLAERSVGGPSATMMLQSQTLGLLLVAPFALRPGRRLTVRRLTAAERRQVIALVVAAAALEVTFSVFYYLLIDHIGAVLTTLIVASSPLFSLLAGALFLKERVGVRLALGAAVTLCGVLLAIVSGA